jgi:hypothetical protein
MKENPKAKHQAMMKERMQAILLVELRDTLQVMLMESEMLKQTAP